MTEILPKRCDKCGDHLIIKIKTTPNRNTLQWYYWCDHCFTTEVFMEEPLDDE